MVSKILLVRNVIQEVLGIQVTPEDADTIIERIKALQAEEAVEHTLAPDGAERCACGEEIRSHGICWNGHDNRPAGKA